MYLFALQQKSSLQALGTAALDSAAKKIRQVVPGKKPIDLAAATFPGETIRHEIAPRSNGLINAYEEWCGARTSQNIPPHLFPQWAFPAMAESMRSLPFGLTQILNQGCKIRVLAPVPRDQTLQVEAQLMAVQTQPGKIRITQRVDTLDQHGQCCISAEVYTFVPTPLPKDYVKDTKGMREDATEFREVGTFSASPKSGLEYACLSGDFNPIHWIPPYAKLSGFSNHILHGFALLAIAWESVQNDAEGAKTVSEIDVRFLKPFVLPNTAHVGLGSVVETAKTGSGYVAPIQLQDQKQKLCVAGTVGWK